MVVVGVLLVDFVGGLAPAAAAAAGGSMDVGLVSEPSVLAWGEDVLAGLDC